MEVAKTNAPTPRTPVSCTRKLLFPERQTASVPQTPAKRCAGTAPTTSSILMRSSSFSPAVHRNAPTAPMIIASQGSVMSGPAVIATRPAMAPLRAEKRSVRPRMGRETKMAVSTPAAAARLVLTRMLLIATASATPARASCEPPLKPNHPNQRMKTPRVTAGMLDGGVILTEPSLRNLPQRAPTTMAPAKAAQPPVEWTMVEPAKSWKPIWESQPPPHVQAPTTG